MLNVGNKQDVCGQIMEPWTFFRLAYAFPHRGTSSTLPLYGIHGEDSLPFIVPFSLVWFILVYFDHIDTQHYIQKKKKKKSYHLNLNMDIYSSTDRKRTRLKHLLIAPTLFFVMFYLLVVRRSLRIIFGNYCYYFCCNCSVCL